MRRLRSAVRFLNRTDGSIGEQAVRSSVWVVLSSTCQRAAGFVGSMVLARLLLPEHFGLFGVVLFFLRGLDVFTQTGLTAAIIHRSDRVEEALDAAWTVFVLRGLALGGAMVGIAPFVADFYGEPALADMVRVIALFFVIQGFLNSHLIRLRKELDFKPLAIFEIGIALLRLPLVVTLAYVYRNAWALVVGPIVDMAMRVVMSYVIVGERPRWSLPRRLVRELFGYGKFVTGALIAGYLATSIDNALIGKVLGVGALGLYSLAFQLGTLPATEVKVVIARVMFPAFSKLQGDLTALRDRYLAVLKVVTTLAVPAAAGMLVLAPEAVTVIYGARWLPIVGPLYVLCVLGVTEALSATTEPVFRAVGRPQVGFYATTLKLMLILVLIYPLSVRYGLIGAAVAVTLPSCLEQAVLWALLRHVMDCRAAHLVKTLIPPIGATAVMSLAVCLLKASLSGLPPILLVTSCVLAGACCYGGVIFLLDRRLIDDARRRLTGIVVREN
jgi:PST family polysaccharide transporter/lipopolysaccharide exporter